MKYFGTFLKKIPTLDIIYLELPLENRIVKGVVKP